MRFWILFAAAMVVSSIGWKKLVWFIRVRGGQRTRSALLMTSVTDCRHL